MSMSTPAPHADPWLLAPGEGIAPELPREGLQTLHAALEGGASQLAACLQRRGCCNAALNHGTDGPPGVRWPGLSQPALAGVVVLDRLVPRRPPAAGR